MFTNAKLETSCKNERAKIAFYSVYYTKYPEQKWRRSIAKDVDFFNREFKIYDATGSTTRLRKKEICHARQKL
jgi:hypothetical protein